MRSFEPAREARTKEKNNNKEKKWWLLGYVAKPATERDTKFPCHKGKTPGSRTTVPFSFGHDTPSRTWHVSLCVATHPLASWSGNNLQERPHGSDAARTCVSPCQSSDGLVEAPAEGAANVYPGANPPLHKQETLCFSSRSLQYQSPTPAGLVQ
jgi:hypothetical protein